MGLLDVDGPSLFMLVALLLAYYTSFVDAEFQIEEVDYHIYFFEPLTLRWTGARGNVTVELYSKWEIGDGIIYPSMKWEVIHNPVLPLPTSLTISIPNSTGHGLFHFMLDDGFSTPQWTGLFELTERPTPSPTPSPTGLSSPGLSTGQKAGVGVGVSVAALIIIGFAGFFLVRRKKNRSATSKHSKDADIPELRASSDAAERGELAADKAELPSPVRDEAAELGGSPEPKEPGDLAAEKPKAAADKAESPSPARDETAALGGLPGIKGPGELEGDKSE